MDGLADASGGKGGGGVTASGLAWHVEIPQKSLPVAVASKIVEVVETMWKKELAEHATSGEGGVQDWRLEPMFVWAEQKYSMLLGMVPECIDVYEGCNSAGATCRRYTLVDAETEDDDSAAAAGGGMRRRSYLRNGRQLALKRRQGSMPSLLRSGGRENRLRSLLLLKRRQTPFGSDSWQRMGEQSLGTFS